MIIAVASARTKSSSPYLLILFVRITVPSRTAGASSKIRPLKASTQSYSVSLAHFSTAVMSNTNGEKAGPRVLLEGGQPLPLPEDCKHIFFKKTRRRIAARLMRSLALRLKVFCCLQEWKSTLGVSLSRIILPCFKRVYSTFTITYVKYLIFV